MVVLWHFHVLAFLPYNTTPW